MKIRTITLFLIAFVTVSCSHAPKNDIERAAQGYLEAAGDYRLDDAMPYASHFTRETVLPFYKKIMTKADSNFINSNRPTKITIQSSRMLTDTTACVYYHKHTPIKDVDDSVLVIHEEGQWLVHVDIAIPTYLLLDSTSLPNRPAIDKIFIPDSHRHSIRRRR